jgi:hypothetical protein
LFNQRLRRLGDSVACAQNIFIPEIGLHLDQIDHTKKIRFRSDGQLNRRGVRSETTMKLFDNPFETRPDPIHFVDEDNPRNLVTARLFPNSFALRLYSLDGAKNAYHSI